MDDGKLVVEPFAHGGRNLFVAKGQILLAELPQVGIVRHSLWQRKVRQMQMPKLEVDLASLGDLLRIGERLRVIVEKLLHLLGRAHVELPFGIAHARRIMDALARLNREQDVVRLRVLLMHIVDVVRRHESDAELLRQLDDACKRCLFIGDSMVLNLKEEVLSSKDVDVLLDELFRALSLAAQDRLRNLARHAGAEAYKSLMVLAQDVLVDARLIVHSLCIGERDEFHEASIAFIILRKKNQMIVARAAHLGAVKARLRRKIRLAADDGTDSLLLRFLIKINDAVHRPVIGDRDGIHAKFLRACDKLGDAARTVEKAVTCMNVQMRKGNLRHDSLLHHSSVF